MIHNPIIQNLPTHLKSFITDQDYNQYTPQNHAVWRYVMRQNLRKLATLADPSYLAGLKRTGISIDRIPSIIDMNMILSKIGWAAVAVDGFIPPAAFMEFQKYKVLVIAADIRPFDQIEYTPAPDIIHEAAGHAPIIAEEEYAHYLQNFGEIGSKALSSKKDYELYEAIRHLSILKADPYSNKANIFKAEKDIELLNEHLGMPSEMALIRNLHWWTVEYGLIGDVKKPKIYGAGLLSSIAESIGAMESTVTKIPYSIDAMHYNFDITKPQPQLFVTPDFKYLNHVLEEFANQMALRHGGLEGILKAIESENTATAKYASGLQVSGIFTDVIVHNGQAIYVKTNGPTTLSYNDKVLQGHGKDTHEHGFGSPIGRIKGSLKPTRLLSDRELSKMGFIINQPLDFEFESGLSVKGILHSITRKKGDLLLLSFRDCSVMHENELLFDPSWGMYDMAVGESITSVFNGPADAEAYGLTFETPKEKTHKIQYSKKDKQLHEIYQVVRKIREGGESIDKISEIWNNYLINFSADWLLAAEMLEISRNNNLALTKQIIDHLENLKTQYPDFKNLIDNVLV
jgi:phenylalanine-4-hydroxylase